MIGTEEIERRFTCHKPSDEAMVLLDELATAFKQVAHLIDRNCPDGREKALSMTHLEDVRHYAVAAIVRPASGSDYCSAPKAEASAQAGGGCCKDQVQQVVPCGGAS